MASKVVTVDDFTFLIGIRISGYSNKRSEESIKKQSLIKMCNRIFSFVMGSLMFLGGGIFLSGGLLIYLNRNFTLSENRPLIDVSNLVDGYVDGRIMWRVVAAWFVIGVEMLSFPIMYYVDKQVKQVERDKHGNKKKCEKVINAIFLGLLYTGGVYFFCKVLIFKHVSTILAFLFFMTIFFAYHLFLLYWTVSKTFLWINKEKTESLKIEKMNFMWAVCIGIFTLLLTAIIS